MEAPPCPLLLRAPPPDWKVGTQLILQSFAAPIKKERKIERAGRGYQQWVDKEEYIDFELDEKKQHEERLKRRSANRKKIVLPKSANLDDYYALLGLSATHMTSSEEQIRTAYRKISLTYHPDKAAPEEREEAEQLYKAMQEAYDTLIDPARRRIYDSTRTFDDTIPDEDEGADGEAKPEAFFEIYKPVFARNAWFSKKKPVPVIGDMSTHVADVHEFYDFWLSFQSWREFSHPDEHRMEDAESREERRWMERENRKLVAEQVKKEKKRIRRLVNNAMKVDPRLLRAKRLQKEEKEAKKRAKMEARRKRELERKAAEEAQRQGMQRKADTYIIYEKRQRDAAKNTRKQFRRLCRKFKFSKFDIDTVVERLPQSKLEDLYKRMEANSEEAKATFEAETSRIAEEKKRMAVERERELEEKRAKARLKAALEKEAEAKRAIWTDIEVMWLAKAVTRFPSGSHNRWGQIANMVNQMAKNPASRLRTEKDVIKQTRLMNQQKLQTGFSTAYNKKLKFTAGDGTVFDSAPVNPTNGGDANSNAVKEEKKSTTKAQSGDGKKKKRRKKGSKKTSKKSGEPKPENGNQEVSKPKGMENENRENDSGNEWSAMQQQALEQALRTTPKGPDRWDNIAEKVPGKTRKACVRRFKEIRAKIMEQRAKAKS
ncbi:hypothetical protein AAMO2058_001102900 [Amorphochlora amoebiformis]